jgi:alpha-amylase
MSDGDPGAKWMDVSRPNARFTDITGHDTREVVTNSDGWGEFRCPGGSVSVWVQE